MKYFLIGCSLCLFLILGCKKKTEDTPVKNTNVLCDGKGGSDLFPLSIGNYWVYTLKKNGVIQPNKAKIVVLKDSFTNGKAYFFLTDSSNQMFNGSRFFRKDTGNHTQFYITGYNEATEVLNAPSDKQMWGSLFYTRVAVNLNASLKTSSCNYKGLVQANEMDGGFVKNRRYYKKGLGLVYLVAPNAPMSGDSIEYILTDARIK
jgi:hypothetical protein